MKERYILSNRNLKQVFRLLVRADKVWCSQTEAERVQEEGNPKVEKWSEFINEVECLLHCGCGATDTVYGLCKKGAFTIEDVKKDLRRYDYRFVGDIIEPNCMYSWIDGVD